MELFRVMLAAEDGVYCQEDGFQSFEAAQAWGIKHKHLYGEGQSLLVEMYNSWH